MRSAHLLNRGVLTLVLAAVSAAGAQAPSPQAVVNDLIAADRAFSEAAANTDVVSALTAMFAPDVVMPLPGGTFARGADAAAAALRSNAEQARARATWTPARGGISADGRHGFTFGYMTITGAGGTETAGKYLSYWIKGPDGWRVAAYKRTRAARPPESPGMMRPALPPRMTDVSNDERTIAGYRRSLDAAERAFSAEAQTIGIGPAFAKYGSADAINLGPPDAPEVIVGSEAIGRFVGSAYPPGRPGIAWAPDEVLVASSGDLGVTIGMITADKPGPGGGPPRAVPFFTIWRRATPADPWRYVAE